MEVCAKTSTVRRYSIVELKEIRDDCAASSGSDFDDIRCSSEDAFREIETMVFRRSCQQQAEQVAAADGMTSAVAGKQNQHRKGRNRGGSRSVPIREGASVAAKNGGAQTAAVGGGGFNSAGLECCEGVGNVVGQISGSMFGDGRCGEDRVEGERIDSVRDSSLNMVAVHDDGGVGITVLHGQANELGLTKRQRRQTTLMAENGLVEYLDQDGSERVQVSSGIDAVTCRRMSHEQARNSRSHHCVGDVEYTRDINNGDYDDDYRDGYEEEEKEDEQMGSLQARAFAVRGEPNFDAGPPSDGLEYLRRVRWEAARCPGVKTVRVDPKKLKANQTSYMPKIPDVPVCPPHLRPSKEWQTAFIADFSSLRSNLQKIERPQPGRPGLKLPKVKDEAGWKVFCFGKASPSAANAKGESLGSGGRPRNADPSIDSVACDADEQQQSPRHSVEIGNALPVRREESSLSSGDDASSLATSSVCTTADDTSCEGGGKEADASAQSALQPTLDVMLKLDDITTTSLLRHQISWLENIASMTERRFAWLFALLAQVGKPLDADTTAAIRSLLRWCARMRSKKQSVDDPELPRLNIMIAITGKYFGQSEDCLDQ